MPRHVELADMTGIYGFYFALFPIYKIKEKNIDVKLALTILIQFGERKRIVLEKKYKFRCRKSNPGRLGENQES